MHCGVGDYTGRLASALSRDVDTRVSVLTSAFDAPSTAAQGFEVLRAMQSWHAHAVAKFSEITRALDPDVIHIQFPTQGYDSVRGLAAIAFHSRFRCRVPVVVTLHEFLPRSLGRLERQIHALALLASKIVAVRPGYFENLSWFMKALVGRDKVRFIPNASSVPQVNLSAAERASLKRSISSGSAQLVAFFGFSYPHKGVDLLFRIADPARHHLVLIGELSPADVYHRQLLALAESAEWRGRVTTTGFVDNVKAAQLLAAADAAVFPYRVGGGIWNSSLHAATDQGTFALTTSKERNGYDAAANVYYARPGDVEEMRQALLRHQGVRKEPGDRDAWIKIASLHKALYLSLVAGTVRR